MEVIKTFTTDEHRFLSNFYPHKKDGSKYPHSVKVVYEGIEFDCVENAYQAAKSLDKELHLRFSKMSPYETKAYFEEHKSEVREGFHKIKLGIMKGLITQKFENTKELKERLIATKDFILQEGNDWGDTFWGVCEGVGENNLGKILMEIRASLR